VTDEQKLALKAKLSLSIIGLVAEFCMTEDVEIYTPEGHEIVRLGIQSALDTMPNLERIEALIKASFPQDPPNPDIN